MKIIIRNDDGLFEKKLRSFINTGEESKFLDLAFYNEPKMILVLLEENMYKISYTRPILINPFKFPADYEYAFYLKEDIDGKLIVKGKVRFKRFILGLLLFVVFIIIYRWYDYLFREFPFSFFSLVGINIVLIVFLLIENIVFRMKVRKFLNSLDSQI